MAVSNSSPPTSYSEANVADIQHVRRATERAFRANTLSFASVLTLLLLVITLNVLQWQAQSRTAAILPRKSDCIHAPQNTTVVHSVWPASATIRNCIAQHVVFVQLEHFCRMVRGQPALEVHAYVDTINKKITITVNALPS